MRGRFAPRILPRLLAEVLAFALDLVRVFVARPVSCADDEVEVFVGGGRRMLAEHVEALESFGNSAAAAFHPCFEKGSHGREDIARAVRLMHSPG